MHLNIEDMTRFLVMEKLGTSLIDVYETIGNKMKKTDVLKIGIELFNLIEKLHSRKITHQDLKPDNILFDKSYSMDELAPNNKALKCENLELI